KFGGTSVAGQAQWRTIRDLVRQQLQENHRVLLVCSAVAGITNLLTDLADHPVESTLELILQRHTQLAADLAVDDAGWLYQGRQRLQACMLRLQQGENHAARADL